MGLKTKNFTIKRTGQFLETAYAKLEELIYTKYNTITAVFGIHLSRKYLDDPTLEPIELVTLTSTECNYTVDRNKSFQEEAYNMAKTQIIKKPSRDDTGKRITLDIPGIFNGWDDDYVEV